MTPAGAAGPLMFARYAFPPNDLGYCGPGDPAGLLELVAAGRPDAELAARARLFEGAWPYLELIAGCNGLSDALDARVVEAYWLGNELTHRVPLAALARSLEERFFARAGRASSSLVEAAIAGGVPQHAFHVFAVYPWLGLLRAGREGPALTVLDRCRVRWGRVLEVAPTEVRVASRPLTFVGSRLRLGDEAVEVARWRAGADGLVEGLGVGDTVALHWDWVCDRLSDSQRRWLADSTRRNLDAVNALGAPGPAVAVGA